jgi:hypothetical protein
MSATPNDPLSMNALIFSHIPPIFVEHLTRTAYGLTDAILPR